MREIDDDAPSVRRVREYPSGKVSIVTALKRQRDVMHAVILRDIRSRYFNHGLGYLIVPLFPVAHIFLLIGIYKVTGRQAIFGDDMALFFATVLISTES
jgi:capsular polysaccharide transport system permease protein